MQNQEFIHFDRTRQHLKNLKHCDCLYTCLSLITCFFFFLHTHVCENLYDAKIHAFSILTRKRLRLRQPTVTTIKEKNEPSKLDTRNVANLCKGRNCTYEFAPLVLPQNHPFNASIASRLHRNRIKYFMSLLYITFISRDKYWLHSFTMNVHRTDDLSVHFHLILQTDVR